MSNILSDYFDCYNINKVDFAYKINIEPYRFQQILENKVQPSREVKKEIIDYLNLKTNQNLRIEDVFDFEDKLIQREGEIKRQVIYPENTDYGENFYAAIFNIQVGLGMNEQRLIWTRTSGFLAINGFIINSIIQLDGRLFSQMTISIFGYFISLTWILMNYAGWLNQNSFFRKAMTFDFKMIKLPLSLDYWKDDVTKEGIDTLKPYGIIYGIAQSIPISLSIVYYVLLFYSIKCSLLLLYSSEVILYIERHMLLINSLIIFLLVLIPIISISLLNHIKRVLYDGVKEKLN